jgi:hypothetical protein
VDLSNRLTTSLRACPVIGPPCGKTAKRVLSRRRPIAPSPPRPDARKNAPPAIASRSPRRLGVIRKPAPNHLSIRIVPASVPKRRRRGPQRLQRIFRTDAAGWPHRVAGSMGLHRTHPRVSAPRDISRTALTAAHPRSGDAGRPSPLERGAGWSGATWKMGEAIPRGEFPTCDPRRSQATTGASVRLACVAHTHPYSPR